MAVQTHTGTLTALGAPELLPSRVWLYPMIEIGDREFRKVQASQLMSSYLQLGVGKEVTLLLGKGGFRGTRVLAMKVDGKVKKDHIGAYAGAVILCGLGTLIFFVGGLWPVALVAGFLGFLSARNLFGLIQFG